MKRVLKAVAVTAVLGAVGLAVFLGWNALLPEETETTADGGDHQPVMAIDTIDRRTLKSSESFGGELHYGDPYLLPGAAFGTLTWAPEEDSMLRSGDVAYRVDEKPTIIAHGELPMYRRLEWGSKGVDVRQLQSFLLDQGFGPEDWEPDGTFGRATYDAVRAWQEDVGLTKTGAIDSSQLVFLPDPVRVASAPRVGSTVNGAVLEVSDPEPKVTVSVSSRERAAFGGDAGLEVELPDGRTVVAEVDDIEKVAATQTQQPGTGTSYRVTLLIGTSLNPEPGTVEVTAERTLAADVLTAPTRALIALAEGGYAVEVSISEGTSELRRVTPGEFADGRVEITGDVAAGDQILVPA